MYNNLFSSHVFLLRVYSLVVYLFSSTHTPTLSTNRFDLFNHSKIKFVFFLKVKRKSIRMFSIEIFNNLCCDTVLFYVFFSCSFEFLCYFFVFVCLCYIFKENLNIYVYLLLIVLNTVMMHMFTGIIFYSFIGK